MPNLSHKKAVIFTAPAGWGKTHHVKILKRAFDCDTVQDGWQPDAGVTPGALHLTNCSPTDLANWLQNTKDDVMVVDSGWFYPADEYFTPVTEAGVLGTHTL